MTINHVFQNRTKHIDVDYHFAFEKVDVGELVTRYSLSSHQIVDVLTKLLPKASFMCFGNNYELIIFPSTS